MTDTLDMTLPQFLNALGEARRNGELMPDPYYTATAQLRLTIAGLADGYAFCPITALATLARGERFANGDFLDAAKVLGIDNTLAWVIVRAADEYRKPAVHHDDFAFSSLRVQLDAALGKTQPTAFELHQAEDPHCSCNDCMEDHEARLATRCAFCGSLVAHVRPDLVGDDPTCDDCATAIRLGATLDGSATDDTL